MKFTFLYLFAIILGVLIISFLTVFKVSKGFDSISLCWRSWVFKFYGWTIVSLLISWGSFDVSKAFIDTAFMDCSFFPDEKL